MVCELLGPMPILNMSKTEILSITVERNAVPFFIPERRSVFCPGTAFRDTFRGQSMEKPKPTRFSFVLLQQ